jgi:hypothetical protein
MKDIENKSAFPLPCTHTWINLCIKEVLPFSITVLDIKPFSITGLDITIQYHRSGYYHSVCVLETHLWFNVLLQRHVWLIENESIMHF